MIPTRGVSPRPAAPVDALTPEVPLYTVPFSPWKDVWCNWVDSCRNELMIANVQTFDYV